jgi:hypothetical protein
VASIIQWEKQRAVIRKLKQHFSAGSEIVGQSRIDETLN